MIIKPQPDEYPPFASEYVSLVDTGDVIGLLEQLKDTTYKLFSDLSDEQAMYAYAEGKWTLKQMLGPPDRCRAHFCLPGFCVLTR